MNTIQTALFEVGLMAALYYKLNFSYWAKWVFVRPFIGKKKFSSFSFKRIKPIDCFSCICLWFGLLTGLGSDFNIEGSIQLGFVVYLFALLTETIIER